ncbi:hypothetical protein KFK09_015135 [Dendrobium nobile]|uniref:Bulb-type lectin domain-containing protein n=1 Tax=Dendrobium nobile TaxID=94219 RepID=A0A8T3B5B0_DENNO|nr:hypothetical protein KFK09_015135 [Dendrobium nobile]
MTLPTPLLLSLLSLILLPSPSAANEGNILATGDILPTDGQLSYKDAAFVIQGDCNLILYNKANGFQSNTHGFGTNCTLTLSDHGQLLIKDGQGLQVWSSPADPRRANTSPSSAPTILRENSKLTSRDYTLEITEDCNLEFTKASVGVVWQSETKGKGRHCFVRLDDHGRLAVVNDRYKFLWWSKQEGVEGEYVLVVQINGQAAVYGPVVWSTGSCCFGNLDRFALRVSGFNKLEEDK